MGALAALTKAPGQFLALFVVLVAVGDWLLVSLRMGRLDWRLAGLWVVDLVLWGGVAALLFVALWPVMWVNPVGTLMRMLTETFGKVEEGHLVFFMGQPTGYWSNLVELLIYSRHILPFCFCPSSARSF